MFQTGVPTTTLLDASLEIGIILLGTFILGMMMGWIIKPKSLVYDEQEDVLEKVPEVKPSYALEKKREKKVLHPNHKDDFKMVQGITPKIEKFLHENNITSFDDIVKEDVAGLEALLLKGGSSFQKVSPVTWPDQARLAAHGKWTELEEYQEILAMTEK